MATVHAKRRAKRRGIPMSRARLDLLAAMIRANDPAVFFIDLRESQGELWAVPHAGQYRPVVFCRDTGNIVTILPAHTLPLKFQAAGI